MYEAKHTRTRANARVYIIYSEPLSSALRQVSHLRTALALCRGFDDGRSREEILRDAYTVHPFHTVNRQQLYFPSLLIAGRGDRRGTALFEADRYSTDNNNHGILCMIIAIIKAVRRSRRILTSCPSFRRYNSIIHYCTLDTLKMRAKYLRL